MCFQIIVFFEPLIEKLKIRVLIWVSKLRFLLNLPSIYEPAQFWKYQNIISAINFQRWLFSYTFVLLQAVQGALLAVGTVVMKLFTARILRVTDDKHISDIFRSKFTNFSNFHTMLYTCAAEFDFMEKEVRITPILLHQTAYVELIIYRPIWKAFTLVYHFRLHGGF